MKYLIDTHWIIDHLSGILKVGKECPECHGTGKYLVLSVRSPYKRKCRCHVCNGTGKVRGKWKWEPKV